MHTAVTIKIGHDARPAPLPAPRASRAEVALVVTASLVLHSGVFAAFQREASPLASVGVQSISVEIVLGTDRAAGVAQTPVQAEAAVDAVAAQGEAPELVKPETARPENVAEIMPEAKPAEAVPVRNEQLLAVTAEPASDGQTVTAPRKPRPIAQRSKKDQGEDNRMRESRAALASVAASGIGRGRSDTDSNYRGLVRAQLVRHQHFPPAAERNGDRGTAVVAFAIEPSGTVSRVTLVRGTGVASLDREAQAVVHRSSPFPPPPSQRRELFRVPLNFDIR